MREAVPVEKAVAGQLPDCLILQKRQLSHISVKTLNFKHGRHSMNSHTGVRNVVICTPMAVNFGKEFACRTESLL